MMDGMSCARITVVLLLSLVVVVPSWAGDPARHEPGETIGVLLERARDRKLTPRQRRDAAERALELARIRGDTKAKAEANYALAQAEWDAEDLGPALEHCSVARRLYKVTGDSDGALSALRRSGDILYRLGDYGGAMERYVTVLQEAEELAATDPGPVHRLAVGHVHVTMGNVLRRTGDEDQALAEYQSALKIYEGEGYELGQAGLELNMGNLLFDTGRNEEALHYYERAVDLARKVGNDPLLSMALTNLGATEVRLGKLDSARAAIHESVAICQRIGRTRGQLHNHTALGDLLAAEGHPRRALGQYETALDLAKELEDLNQVAAIHGRMADLLHAMGRDGAAFDHLKKEREISRKILDAEEAARISGLRTATEAERREAQLALLQQREAAERSKNRLLGLSLGVVSLLLIVTVGGLLSRARVHRQMLRERVELEQAFERMKELSRTDELTGLPNRRDALLRLADDVQRSARNGETFGLGIADVDGLKAVNDRFGHQVGDRLLMGVSQAIVSCLREPDYVARWGGDEFLLIFAAVDTPGLRTAMERVMAAVRRTRITHEVGTLNPTLSCGLVLCSGGDLERWLQKAYAALYRSKSKGRNGYEIHEG